MRVRQISARLSNRKAHRTLLVGSRLKLKLHTAKAGGVLDFE